MKKLILSTLTLLIAASAFAQPMRNNEIGISYGLSGTNLVIGILNSFDAVFSEEASETPVRSSSGVIGVEYFRRLGDLVSIGGGLTYFNTSNNVSASDPTKRKGNYFSVMPAVKLHWYQREWFSAYSKFAVGLKISSVNTEEKVEAGVCAHASLLGLEVGRGLRGFTELGIGRQGFIQLGLRYRF